jgi:hypothetical protein
VLFIFRKAIGSPKVQTALVGLNILLFTASRRRLQRAKFHTNVRLISQLNKDELQLLIKDLPSWVKFADWERASTVQAFLSLLWPSFNTLLCNALRNVMEEKLQAHKDFGHVIVSRLSFGRHPPNLAGIKAVPMQTNDDAMAIIVDLDVRWAGQPDVALRLTKMRGVTVGLSTLQIAGVVRLVMDPIIENPPFIKKISLTLLDKPYLDFDLNILGGPDLMSLPALSGWLSTAIQKIAVSRIVYPKSVDIHIPGGGGGSREGTNGKDKSDKKYRRSESIIDGDGDDDEAAIDHQLEGVRPLGILIVDILDAQVESRRSTFLGRLKPVTPRVLLLVPPSNTNTVMQAALTGGEGEGEEEEEEGNNDQQQQRVLGRRTFKFVITSAYQHLQMLVSHRRKGFTGVVGADMPLGRTELSLQQLATTSNNNKGGGGNRDIDSEVTAVATPLDHYQSPQRSNFNFTNEGEGEGGFETPMKSVKSDGIDHDRHWHDAQTLTPMGSGMSEILSPMGSAMSHTPGFLTALDNGSDDDDDDGDEIDDDVVDDGKYMPSPPAPPPPTSSLSPPAYHYQKQWHCQPTSSSSSLYNSTAAKQEGGEGSLLLNGDGIWVNVPATKVLTLAGLFNEALTSSAALQRKIARREKHSGNISSVYTHNNNNNNNNNAEAGGSSGKKGNNNTIDTTAVPSSNEEQQSSKALNTICLQTDDDEGQLPTGSSQGEGWLHKIHEYVLGNNVDEDDGDSSPLYVSEDELGDVGMSGGDDNNKKKKKKNNGGSGSRRVSLQKDSVEHTDSLAAQLHLRLRWMPLNAEELAQQQQENIEDGTNTDIPIITPRPRKNNNNNNNNNKKLTKNKEQQQQDEATPLSSKSSSSSSIMSPPDTNTTQQQPTPPTETPVPRPSIQLRAGIVAVRVVHTKLDLAGRDIANPVLAVSTVSPIILNAGASASTRLQQLHTSFKHNARLLTMEASSGERPGTLHWSKVFHLPVDLGAVAAAGAGAGGGKSISAIATTPSITWPKICIEIGDAASASKFILFGADLYCLDAHSSYEADVTVVASTVIQLQELVNCSKNSKRSTRGNYRLKEARHGVHESEKLPLGTVMVQLAWYPVIVS